MFESLNNANTLWTICSGRLRFLQFTPQWNVKSLRVYQRTKGMDILHMCNVSTSTVYELNWMTSILEFAVGQEK